jgi:hypothetical protein
MLDQDISFGDLPPPFSIPLQTIPLHHLSSRFDLSTRVLHQISQIASWDQRRAISEPYQGATQ